MRKLLVVLALVACSLFLIGSPALAGGNADKVTICHRTNSITNPYVQITVDQSAVDGQKGGNPDHYGRHQGPVFAPGLKAMGTKWGDIIPPVAPFHEGLNWTDEGRGIYDNGCKPVLPPEPTTTTTAPEVTTTTVTSTDGTTDGTVGENPPPPGPDAPAPELSPALDELPATGAGEAVALLIGVGAIVLGVYLVLRYR